MIKRIAILTAFTGWSFFGLAVEVKHRVAITQIVEHPALDLARQGILDALKESSVGISTQVDYQNAQGNMVTVTQIAAKILSNPPDAIVAIGTPSAQSVVNHKNKNTPVIFTPISEPVDAKLVVSLEKPGGLATGTTDRTSLEGHLQFISELVPSVKTIGVVYNPGEANSVSNIKELKQLAPKFGWKVVEKTVTKTADVSGAVSQLNQVEAIFVTTDNTVVSAMDSAAKMARQMKKPLFVSEPGSVERGALAGLSLSYYDLGRLTGEMLVKVLTKQASPKDIPVAGLKDLKVYWNEKTAKSIGMALPPKYAAKAVLYH